MRLLDLETANILMLPEISKKRDVNFEKKEFLILSSEIISSEKIKLPAIVGSYNGDILKFVSFDKAVYIIPFPGKSLNELEVSETRIIREDDKVIINPFYLATEKMIYQDSQNRQTSRTVYYSKGSEECINSHEKILSSTEFVILVNLAS